MQFFTRATFLLVSHESKTLFPFIYFFFPALSSKDYSLPILTKIYWSKQQKLIPSKIGVILPGQKNSRMKPVGIGNSVQGSLPCWAVSVQLTGKDDWFYLFSSQTWWFLSVIKCRRARRFRSGTLLNLSYLCKLHFFCFPSCWTY